MTRIHFNRNLAAGALGLALFLGSTAALAHHEIAGKFDLSKPLELSGVVTSVDWRNPHVHVFMNVTTGGATLASKRRRLDSLSSFGHDVF